MPNAIQEMKARHDQTVELVRKHPGMHQEWQLPDFLSARLSVTQKTARKYIKALVADQRLTVVDNSVYVAGHEEEA